MLLNELLKTIPPDTEEARESCARALQSEHSRGTPTGDRAPFPAKKSRGRSPGLGVLISIPVRLVPRAASKAPEARDRGKPTYRSPAGALAPDARAISPNSGQTTSDSILGLIRGLVDPQTQRPHLQAAVDLATLLLERTQGFDLAAWILEVNEDVLGTYHFTVLSAPDPQLDVRAAGAGTAGSPILNCTGQ